VTRARLAALEAIPFRIPMASPMRWSGGFIDAAEHVLLRLRDSDGATGVAEAVPRPMLYGETTGSVLAFCDAVLRPTVLGLPVDGAEGLLCELDGLPGNHTARAAFELALADLRCRRLGVSCHRWLGGAAASQRVTQVMTSGPPAEVAAQCAALRERHGITSFKLKVGHDLANDVATIALVRREQPDAFLYADANLGFDGLEALELGRRVRDLGVAWVEEPVRADAVVARGRAAADRAGGPALFGDESCTTPGEAGREAVAGRSHLVSIKVARTAYRGSARIRALCGTAGLPAVIGSQGDSGLGTLCALAFGAAHPTTARLPGEYGWFLKLAGDLLAEPLRVQDGALRVPTGPGNGAVLDEASLDRCRVR
jgi:L-alanine-DL-glutamate epimerase-like enolase superfamily enzyme